MKRIIQAKNSGINFADYKMRGASDRDYLELIKEPVTIMHKGEVKVSYDLLPFDLAPYRDALLRIKYQESTRSNGLKTKSRIFGFAPRVQLRKDFCSATSLAQESPADHELICELGRKISEIYLANAPEVFGEHKQLVKEKLRTEWFIPGTPFTSGIINKNNPLKYHFDTGNFKKVFSCMVAFKKDCGGGHLSLPEYNVGLEIADNSILLFDGQEILHGVTPFKFSSPEGYRYTIVFYSLRRMWDCLTVDDEIARIRNVKTARERKRAQPKE